ncbi:ferrochelatase [Streptococcus pneumoniae]|nr:ferrochelatase [Streptococcus pneumoniae]
MNDLGYIFVPISFISEHIEVLFDNDVECYDLCQELGVTYHRPPMPNTDSRLIDALVATVRANEDKEFKAFLPEEETFDELAPSATTKDIMKETDDLQMPEFVKKLIEKKGRENVKMPYLIKKMLEKAGKLPKE